MKNECTMTGRVWLISHSVPLGVQGRISFADSFLISWIMIADQLPYTIKKKLKLTDIGNSLGLWGTWKHELEESLKIRTSSTTYYDDIKQFLVILACSVRSDIFSFAHYAWASESGNGNCGEAVGGCSEDAAAADLSWFRSELARLRFDLQGIGLGPIVSRWT